MITRYLYGPEIDQLWAKITVTAGMPPTADVSWYLPDRLGSVRQLVASDATILDDIDYDSFGQIVNETHPDNGDRFTYTSREFDRLFGQYNYRERYYGPDVGRFSSEDPLSFKAGDTNLYRYVSNTPTNATDPTGQWSWRRFWIGVGVAGAVVVGTVAIVGTGGLATPLVYGIAVTGVSLTGVAAGSWATNDEQAVAVGVVGGALTAACIVAAPYVLPWLVPGAGGAATAAEEAAAAAAAREAARTQIRHMILEVVRRQEAARAAAAAGDVAGARAHVKAANELMELVQELLKQFP